LAYSFAFSSFLRIACIDFCFEFGREDVPSGNKISSGNGANGRTGNETRQLSLGQFSSRHVSRVSS
jgi:hypothetical protein